MFQASYQPGLQIDAYTVVEEIARGGQGVVLKARAPDGSLAALKLLTAGDERDARRFLQEGRVLANLSHPNLPRAHGSGTFGNTPYLCMDYVEGTDLERFLGQAGVQPVAWTVELLVTVAETVEYLHSRGLLHRDLKPLNVILEAGTQRPVLVDFGLVKRDTSAMTLGSLDGLSLSRTGEIYGTPGYMAPEQVGGAASEAVDVYGLGATLYALLSGVPPFQGASAVSVLSAVQSQPAVDPRTHNPKVPASLARFCLSCLDKDPANRPPSAHAFALGVRKHAQPSRLRLGAGVALAALGVAGVCVSLLVTREPAPGSAVDAQPPEVAVAEPDDAALFAQANALFDADPAGAAALLSQILERTPDSATAYRLRGDAFHRQARFHEAIADFTRARTLGDTEPHLLLNRALAYEATEQPARALDDYATLIQDGFEVAKAHLFRGALRETQGDLRSALADYSAALKVDPQLHPALHNRAGVHARLGNTKEALADHTQALQLKPDFAPSYIGRADLNMWNMNLRPALADLSRALELDPDNAQLYAVRGRVHQRLGKYADARRDHTRSLELEPDGPAAADTRASLAKINTERPVTNAREAELLTRAKRLFKTDPAAATSAITELLSTNPNSALAYRFRGESYALQGRHAEAVADFTRAFELGDTEPHLLLNRGLSFKALNRRDLARTDLTWVIERHPKLGRAYLSRGVLSDEEGDHASALADYTAAILADPSLEAAYCGRATLRLRNGDVRAAREDFDSALALAETVRAYMGRAQAHLRANNPSRAEEDVTRAIRLRPDSAGLHLMRAKLRTHYDDLPGAVRDLTRVLALQEASVSTYLQRGAIHGELRNYLAALEDFTAALRFDPECFEAYFNRSTVFQELGQPAAQLDDLERFLKLAPVEKVNETVLRTVAELRTLFARR